MESNTDFATDLDSDLDSDSDTDLDTGASTEANTEQNANVDRLPNVFTVDVEDYFQVSAFERDICRDRWDQLESRVVASTRRILRVLAKRQVPATFFVLGWVAERYPQLVRDILADGHDLGTHSYWHRLVYQQSPEAFRDDLRRSLDVLSNIAGHPITAYRAPSFSITQQSLWALDILLEEGIRIDSSIFPIYHDRYGMAGARREIHRLRSNESGSLWEFPPTVMRLAGLSMPVGGGGYFRLYPWTVTRRCLNRIVGSGRPFMFYTHPWEVDADQPRLKAGSWVSRARHYVNLSATERKLDHLLGEFAFGRLDDVVQREAERIRRREADETQVINQALLDTQVMNKVKGKVNHPRVPSQPSSNAQ